MNDAGLIGVGTMGSLATRLLLDAGMSLVVFDQDAGAMVRAAALGAATAVSPVDVAARSDIILLILPGPPQIESVVSGPQGVSASARAGQIVVDMSTSDPATTLRMATAVAESGGDFLDAPILGRPSAAGRWVLPVGGAAAVVERARPVLARLGEIVHVGALGAGHTLKLLNALMFSAINAMTAEMMAIAAKSPLDAAVLYETIARSEASTVSGLFRESGRKIVDRDFSPTFSVDLLCKDNGLAVQMARDLGGSPVLGTAVQQLNEAAREQGLGSEDSSALVQVYEGLA